MQLIVDGTMFHGGVFSGNAVVMAAAEAVLDEVLAHGTAIYQHLQDVADQFGSRHRHDPRPDGITHIIHQVDDVFVFPDRRRR